MPIGQRIWCLDKQMWAQNMILIGHTRCQGADKHEEWCRIFDLFAFLLKTHLDSGFGGFIICITLSLRV